MDKLHRYDGIQDWAFIEQRDVTEVPLSPVLTPTYDYNKVPTELKPTQQKTTEIPKRNRTQFLGYPVGFPWLRMW